MIARRCKKRRIIRVVTLSKRVLICILLLATSACGEAYGDGTDGLASGGSIATGGGSSGAAGATGATGGAGGAGAAGAGGDQAWPTPTVPPGTPPPIWPPGAPVDETPWGGIPFCSPYGGYLTADVLYESQVLYVSVTSACDGVGCEPTALDYKSLYRNSGSGWETVFGLVKSSAGRLAGRRADTLIGYSPCPAAEIATDGKVNCLLDGGGGLKTAVHDGSVYSLMRSTDFRLVISRYQDHWTQLAEVEDDDQRDFTIAGNSAFVPGIGQVTRVQLDNGELSYLDVPFRYFDLITPSPSGFVLSTERDELILWEQDGWKSVPLERPPISRATPLVATDGTVYATAGNRFFRIQAGKSELLLELAEGRFDAVTAAGDGGVFLSATTAQIAARCSALRLIWFDGAAFHPL